MRTATINGERPGRQGAKRQSFREDNPRSVLLALLRKYKGYSEERLFSLFKDQVEDDEDYRSVFLEYWFTNNYRAATRKPSAAAVREAKAAHRKKVRSIIGQVQLLALPMPNGKKLADCTGDECLIFGGWLSRMGVKVGKRKIGDVLSETQVRNFI